MTGICPLFGNCIAVEQFNEMLKRARDKPEVYNQIVQRLGLKLCKNSENSEDCEDNYEELDYVKIVNHKI